MNLEFVPFEKAFVSEPVGQYKIKESEYQLSGAIRVVDQGQSLVSGFTDKSDFVRDGSPYIVFGDHTKIIKYIDFPFVVGADGVRLFKSAEEFDPEFLYYFLRSVTLPSDGYGRHSKYLNDLKVPKFRPEDQCNLVDTIKSQLAEVENARQALKCQLQEIVNLANAVIRESIENTEVVEWSLGDVLDEVKKGIGENWADYPVLGATREGLATGQGSARQTTTTL